MGWYKPSFGKLNEGTNMLVSDLFLEKMKDESLLIIM